MSSKRGDPVCCKECGTTSTPLWRYGPEGSKSLCNACGIRWKRANKAKLNGGGGGGPKKRKSPEAHKRLKQRVARFHPFGGAPEFDRFVQTVEDEYDLVCPGTPERDEHSGGGFSGSSEFDDLAIHSDHEEASPTPLIAAVDEASLEEEAAKQRLYNDLWLYFISAQQAHAGGQLA